MDFQQEGNNRKLTDLEKSILDGFNQQNSSEVPDIQLASSEIVPEDSNFIATSALAQEFGYDPIHIARIARQGRVESIRKGKQWFVSRTSLETYRKNAEENRRMVALAGIKILPKNSFKKSYSDALNIFSALLSAHIEKRDESSRRRVEFLSKFFTPTLEAVDHVSSRFGNLVAELTNSRLPIRETAERVVRIVEDYNKRQKESTQRREKLFSTFFAPTAEIFNQLNSNPHQSVFRLSTELKTEFASKIAPLSVKFSNFTSPAETTKRSLSRRPTVPSLVLSQIAEHFRASGVSFRTSMSDGLKLTSLALFILLFSMISMSDLSGSMFSRGRSNYSAGIFDIFKNGVFKSNPSPSLTPAPSRAPAVVGQDFESRLRNLEIRVNSLRSIQSGNITKIIEKTIIQPAGSGAPTPVRTTSLDVFIADTITKFASIDERFRITPTLWVTPAGFTSSGGTTVVNTFNTDNIDASTIDTETLTVSGTGSLAVLSVSGSASFGNVSGAGLSDCDSESQTLNWDSTTKQFSCLADAGGAGSSIKIESSSGTSQAAANTLNFDAGHFSLTASGTTESAIRINWGNGTSTGVASKSTANIWTAVNTFSGGASTSRLEITNTSGVSASISRTFFVDATNQRVGIGTSTPAVALQIVGGASLSTNFEASGYGSVSLFFGAGLSSCTGKLLWSVGAFTCGIDAGSSAISSIRVKEQTAAGGNNYSAKVSSMSFESGAFSLSQSASSSNETMIRLDYTNGPASRSINQNILAIWDFRAGASFSNDVEFYDRTNDSMFAIFSSASVGRFGLGDTTPETLFEVASSSGTTASISNTFFVDATNKFVGIGSTSAQAVLSVMGTSATSLNPLFSVASVSGTNYFTITKGGKIGIGTPNPLVALRVVGAASISTNFEASGYASASSLFITNTTNTGNGMTGVFNGVTTGNAMQLTSTGAITGAMLEITANNLATGTVASFSATGLTDGGALLNFTVRASTAGVGGDILVVKDTTGSIIASWSYYGRLATKGSIKSRGINSSCTGVNTGGTGTGCLDYAETYGTSDMSLAPGEVVIVDSSNAGFVKRGDNPDIVLGIVSTNPGALINGNEFRAGADTQDGQTGYVPIALSGRVPVKINYENGSITAGDYLALSSVPGVAMKAKGAGRVVGMALEGADQESGKNSVIVFVNLHYWPGTGYDSLSPAEGQFLSKMVSKMKNLVVEVKELIAQKITAKFIKTDNLEAKNGITTYDEQTGEAYCIKISGGQIVTSKGACGSLPESSSVPTVDNGPSDVSGGSTTEVTPEEPVVQPEPENQPEETVNTEETPVIEEPVSEEPPVSQEENVSSEPAPEPNFSSSEPSSSESPDHGNSNVNHSTE